MQENPVFWLMGPFWFGLALVEILAIFWAITEGKVIAAFALAFSWLAIATFFGDASVYNWIKNDPINFLYYFGSYLFIGCIWVLFNFYNKAKDRKYKYDILKKKWLLSKGIDEPIGNEIPVELVKEWTEYVLEFSEWRKIGELGKYSPSIKIHFWDYNAEHTIELFFWVFSFVHWIAKDFVNKLIQKMARLGERITSFVFRNVDKDFDVNK